MERVKESFVLFVDEHTIEIVHDGLKKFADMENGIENLRDFLKEKIAAGEYVGWIPYANFEASIKWNVEMPGEKKGANT